MGTNSLYQDFFVKFSEGMNKVPETMMDASSVLLDSLDTDIAQTDFDIVYEEDRVRLKHYMPEGGRTTKSPILVNYALINRETMLDLQPGKSVVEKMLAEGLEIYMIDWGYPTRKDRYLTIDDHVSGYMDNIVDFILEKHEIDQLNLMGICMGGTFCVMYASLFPEKVKNLVTTVTPANFDTDSGLLHLWMKDLDVDTFIEPLGNMPGDLMNYGFLLLNPARLMVDKYYSFWGNVGNKKDVENFVRMEKWIFDSPDVPGETFKQFIKDCYQKNLLIQSKMEIGGKLLNLKNITMPLLNIYGEHDHLVPPDACNKLTGVVGSKDSEDLCIPTGHIGIYVSSKCQELFAPKVISWLKSRD